MDECAKVRRPSSTSQSQSQSQSRFNLQARRRPKSHALDVLTPSPTPNRTRALSTPGLDDAPAEIIVDHSVTLNPKPTAPPPTPTDPRSPRLSERNENVESTPGVGTSWDVYAGDLRTPPGDYTGNDAREGEASVHDGWPPSLHDRFVTPGSEAENNAFHTPAGTRSIGVTPQGGTSSAGTGTGGVGAEPARLQREIARLRTRLSSNGDDADPGYESFGTPGSTPRSSASRHFDLARAMEELDDEETLHRTGGGDAGGGVGVWSWRWKWRWRWRCRWRRRWRWRWRRSEGTRGRRRARRTRQRVVQRRRRGINRRPLPGVSLEGRYRARGPRGRSRR